MGEHDPFGFVQATETALDLADFEPRPRKVDRSAVEATREVARDAGFTRRAPSPNPETLPPPEPAPKGRKRRVNITELLGLQDRYPETERAQLNMLAPVPVVLRWRALVQTHQVPAWEILEAAMDALAASGADPAAKARRAPGQG